MTIVLVFKSLDIIEITLEEADVLKNPEPVT
jgi:hypothetical protein